MTTFWFTLFIGKLFRKKVLYLKTKLMAYFFKAWIRKAEKCSGKKLKLKPEISKCLNFPLLFNIVEFLE